MRVTLFLIVMICTLQMNSQSYISQSGDSIHPRVYFSVGLFYPNMTTSLRVDSKNGFGTELGLEDDFSFEEVIAVFNAQAIVRVKNRSQFVIAFTNMNRTSNFELDERIEIGDTAFDIGASLDMRFDVNYYALTWRYSFFNNANWNAGLSLGLRAVQFRVKADARFNGSGYGESYSVTAPAALFGLHGSGYLTDRLLARYSIEYFGLSIDELRINVLESRASLEYFIFENVGIGAAYSTTEYRVEDFPLSDDFDGRILFDFSGGNLFLSARF
ncbi:MAG: hypothetical protein ACJAQ4_001738 [Cryomorphaceae bacterium]|jgi:hypothetical protein